MYMPLIVAIFLLQICNTTAEDKCILKSSLYEKEENHLTEPEFGTEVNVFIGDLQILKVNHFDNTITLNFHLKLKWKESRLVYPCPDKAYIILPKTATNWLWLSSIFIIGLKSFKTYALNTNPIHDFYIQFDAINNITVVGYETFLEVVFYCPMDFNNYPLDEHDCYFRMQDYNFDTNILSYKLNDENFNFNQSQQISIMDFAINASPGLPEHEKVQIPNRKHTYSVVGFKINLKRNIKSYITDFYIPSALLVVISWVSTKFHYLYHIQNFIHKAHM